MFNDKWCQVLFVLTVTPALAWSDGAGSTSANFLKISSGARPVAMGEAFIAVADDANAVYWNPAGMMLSPGIGITTTHCEWVTGVNHEFLAYSQRMGRLGAVGASLTYLHTGKFKETLETATGEYAGEGGEIAATDFAFSTAYAQRLGLWLGGDFFRRSMVGVKATYIGQKITGISEGGASFDIGYIYELKRRRLFIAGVVSNIGPKINDSSQPTIIKGGIAYKRRKVFGENDRLTVAAETDGHFDSGIKFNLGGEYKAIRNRKEVALRVGYKFGGDLGGLAGLTTGVGYGYGFNTVDMSIDYALVSAGDFGLTHRVSLSLQIGGQLLPPQASLSSNDEKQEARSEEEIVLVRIKSTPEPTPVATPGKTRYEYVFNFSGDMLFAQGEAKLRSNAHKALGGALQAINEGYPESQVLVVGHTDNIPWLPGGDFKNNYDLSLARADAVRKFFISKGMNPLRLSIVGYGETIPVASNETDAGRTANRRVELVIYGEKEAGVNDLIAEGKLLAEQGDIQAGLVRLLKAAELDPESAKAYLLIGYCYSKLEQREKARQAFEKSLQLNPKDEKLRKFMENRK